MANMVKMQPVTKMWYDYLREGKLMGMKCEHCSTVEFPPVPVCNRCGKHHMEWVEISGEATLVSFCYAFDGSPPFWKEPIMIGEFNLKEGNHVQGFLLDVTNEDEEHLFNSLGAACTMEVIKVSEEYDLNYPAFRIKK